MSSPNPALVSQRGARRMPRLALLLLCAAYVLPGLFGRDPWRNADIANFGYMVSIATGHSSWWAPELGGVALQGGVLPHWLGAIFIYALSPTLDPALAARIPFAILLAAVLAFTWYGTFHLARTEAAQPVAFAFGGEAQPVDYARAMADAAVLALMASLGLLQLGHETTPEMVQLFGVAMFLWSQAAAPNRGFRAAAAAVAALTLMAGGGAPAMALALGVSGAFICLRSRIAAVRRHAAWVGLATLSAVLVAAQFRTWGWRQGFDPRWEQGFQLVRLWLWFMWPAWPLALWTLWRWRSRLTHRHIAVPTAAVGVALMASVVMGGSDRALMLGLPGLAMLAAFALPTLKRGTTAAIDWFSMCFFSGWAIAFWVIYLSLHTGVPAQPALNVARLARATYRSSQLWPLAWRWWPPAPGYGWCVGARAARGRPFGRVWSCLPAASLCVGCC